MSSAGAQRRPNLLAVGMVGQRITSRDARNSAGAGRGKDSKEPGKERAEEQDSEGRAPARSSSGRSRPPELGGRSNRMEDLFGVAAGGRAARRPAAGVGRALPVVATVVLPGSGRQIGRASCRERV